MSSAAKAGGERVGLVVLAAGFVVYFWTSSAAMGWLDSPEFVAASASLGVAHSPGHPLPAMLGYVATLIPIGDITWRVNLVSALCAALGGLATWGAGRELLRALAENLPPRAASWLAGALALVVGASWAVWSSAVRAEVYALQFALSAAMLWAGIAYLCQGSGRALRWGALAAGLALANHHLMALFVLLPLAAAIWAARSRPSARRSAWALLCGSLGLFAITYLPLRAAAHPEVNFAAPSTLGRLVWTLSGSAFAKSTRMEHVQSADVDAIEVTIALAESVSIPLFLLALFGLYLGLRAPGWRRTAALLVAVVVCAAAGRVVLGFDVETPDHHAYLLPAVLALALLALAGLAALCEWITAARHAARGATAVAALALLITAGARFAIGAPEASLRGEWTSDEVARWELESLPPRSLVLLSYFETSFRVSALRAVEHSRPDLDVLDRSFLTYPGHAEEARRRYPHLTELIDAPLRAGAPTPIARLAAEPRPVFVQLHPNLDDAARPHLAPAGPFAALVAGQASRLALRERDRRARIAIGRIADRAGDAEADRMFFALLWHDATRLDQLCATGDIEAAREVYADARRLAPEDETLAASCAAEAPR